MGRRRRYKAAQYGNNEQPNPTTRLYPNKKPDRFALYIFKKSNFYLTAMNNADCIYLMKGRIIGGTGAIQRTYHNRLPGFMPVL